MNKKHDQPGREALEQYLAELLPELNLRLLTDAEPEVFLNSAAGLLWVESITVTACETAPADCSLEKGRFSGPAEWMKYCVMKLRNTFRIFKK